MESPLFVHDAFKITFSDNFSKIYVAESENMCYNSMDERSDAPKHNTERTFRL